MNQTDPSTRTEPEAAADTARTVPRSGREYISNAASSLQRGVKSGAVTATVGGAGLLSGRQSILAGKRKLGLAKLALGVGFLAAALAQWRSHNREGASDVEETDVADTDAVTDETGDAGEEDPAASDAAVETADTGVDSEDLAEAVEGETGEAGGEQEMSDETTTEARTDVDGEAETEEIEHLGEAAFDSQSREVPAPQQAFNRGFLAHSSMVCWGIRERDDAVLITLDYDAVEGLEGVTYVASSEIGTDVRELPIPDAVLNHWDEVIGGGTAVTGGDDVCFVTTESLATDRLLRVLPAEWADDLPA